MCSGMLSAIPDPSDVTNLIICTIIVNSALHKLQNLDVLRFLLAYRWVDCIGMWPMAGM